MSEPRAPLADLRVLDLLEGDRGVFATKMLATLGAEIVTVEPPGGDRLRGDAPFLGGRPGEERGLRWHHYRSGTESLVLDLRGSTADRDRLAALAAGADVVLENFAVGELDSLGLGYEALAAANRGLVMASITPFGQTGPRRAWLGSDLVGYAAGGMMSLTGEPDEPPVRLGGGQAHQFAGMYAAMGVLCAITRRAVTGLGTRVDVSVQEAVAASIADAGRHLLPVQRRAQPGSGRDRTPDRRPGPDRPLRRRPHADRLPRAAPVPPAGRLGARDRRLRRPARRSGARRGDEPAAVARHDQRADRRLARLLLEGRCLRAAAEPPRAVGTGQLDARPGDQPAARGTLVLRRDRARRERGQGEGGGLAIPLRSKLDRLPESRSATRGAPREPVRSDPGHHRADRGAAPWSPLGDGAARPRRVAGTRLLLGTGRTLVRPDARP